MAAQFNLENYLKAQNNLQLSMVNAQVLQNQLERFLGTKDLSDAEKEWILTHRDYLSSLEVALPIDVKPISPTQKEALTTAALLDAWQKEIASQQGILGQLFHESQCIVEQQYEGEIPLSEGEARRLMSSIKDILDGNRWELKDFRELKENFLGHPLPEKGTPVEDEKVEKKGFFARLFGK